MTGIHNVINSCMLFYLRRMVRQHSSWYYDHVRHFGATALRVTIWQQN
jgi:hypothetical protein